MVKKHTIKTMIIAVCVSVEIVFALLAVLIAFLFPNFVTRIGDLFIKQSWEIYGTFVGLPLGGLTFGYKILDSLLHPRNAEEKGLYKWADYHLLRYFGYIPLILCFFGVAVGFIFLLMPESLSASVIGTIYLSVTLAWAVSLVTLGMAKLRIEAILGGAE
jgi:hypothetical protein